MLKKKIAGNWHKIDIWEKEDCIVAYKSGGIILQSLSKKYSERYIPFYNFVDFSIQDNALYILDKSKKVYQLKKATAELIISEKRLYDNAHEIELDGLNLIEEVRAYDFSDEIIICAYKQKGIDFFKRKDKSKVYHFDFPGYTFIDDIKLHKDNLYVADVFGLRILNISVVTKPKLNDNFIYRGWPKDIATKDNFIFVADVLGIKIYNKSENFKLIGKFETNKNRVAKVIIKNSFAFLSCEARGLKIIDISDISNPELISGLLLPKGAWDIHEYEDYLYIASYTDGLIKVSYRDIKKLETVNKFSDNNEVIGIYVNNKAVFAACSYEGFKILDHNLEVQTKIKINDGRCWTILTKEDYLFAACGKGGVLIYDISDIGRPVLLDKIQSSEARDLVIKDDLLYIADGQNGAEIYNIHDVKLPNKINNIPSAAFTRGILVDDEFIYKADGDGGLEIYEKL